MNNKLQIKALGSFLSDWDPKASYKKIIQAMRENSDKCGWIDDHEIVVWEPFENDNLGTIADYIENELESLQHLVKELS
jgi:hypothetical protein